MGCPDIPEHEIWYEFAHSRGPGGQHVNKTSSRATLCFAPAASSVLTPQQKEIIARRLSHRMTKEGVLRISSEKERSQLANKRHAEKTLRSLLEEALRPRARRIATRPSRAANQRRLEEKKARSQIKKQRTRPSTDGDGS